MPSFCSNVIQISKFHFWLVNIWTTVQILRGKYVLCIFVKNVSSVAKKLMLVSGKPEILHTSKLPHAEKKPQNNFFTWGPQHGQNWIWNLQIFFVFFSSCKIVDPVLRIVFNSSPQFHLHPVCRLLGLQLIFFVNLAAGVDCVQPAPKYHSKVKLRS